MLTSNQFVASASPRRSCYSVRERIEGVEEKALTREGLYSCLKSEYMFLGRRVYVKNILALEDVLVVADFRSLFPSGPRHGML